MTPAERVGESRQAEAAGEREIFRTTLVGGRTARILFGGPQPTQAQIEKLIALLQVTKDQYPDTDE